MIAVGVQVDAGRGVSSWVAQRRRNGVGRAWSAARDAGGAAATRDGPVGAAPSAARAASPLLQPRCVGEVAPDPAAQNTKISTEASRKPKVNVMQLSEASARDCALRRRHPRPHHIDSGARMPSSSRPVCRTRCTAPAPGTARGIAHPRLDADDAVTVVEAMERAGQLDEVEDDAMRLALARRVLDDVRNLRQQLRTTSCSSGLDQRIERRRRAASGTASALVRRLAGTACEMRRVRRTGRRRPGSRTTASVGQRRGRTRAGCRPCASGRRSASRPAPTSSTTSRRVTNSPVRFAHADRLAAARQAHELDEQDHVELLVDRRRAPRSPPRRA